MRPIFIGGTGRCGTTKLKEILDCHPDVFVTPPELRIFVDPDGVVDLISALSDNWTPFGADAALHRFRRLCEELGVTRLVRNRIAWKLRSEIVKRGIAPWRYRFVDLDKLGGRQKFLQMIDHLLAELSPHRSADSWLGSQPFARALNHETGPRARATLATQIGSAFSELFDSAPGTTGKLYWVDDTPFNILCADRLLELFPDMRLIHIYRDPRDVAASYHRTKGWGGTVAVSAKRIAAVLEHWGTVRKKFPSERLLEIRFETLVEQRRETIASICAFTGLPYHPALDSIALDRPNIGRWQREFSERESAVVHDVLGGALASLGY